MRKFLAAFLWTACASAQVKLTHLEDRVTVTIDGRPFGSLYFGKEANKPFFHPLTTASGVKVTRSFPLEKADGEPTDHPHQKGLWVGTERLSGMDFWENDSSYRRPRMGRIAFKDVTRLSSGAGVGVLRFLADWIGPEGQTAISEDRTMTFYAATGAARIVDVNMTLTALKAVTFEDHQDAVIGIRLGPAFDEKNGGMPVNAEGLRGEAQTRGKASRYLDWRARINGEDIGVAICDHPENLNAPARWHLRSFGFFTANPFAHKVFDEKAESAAMSLKRNESIHLRYRVIVYSGDFNVAASWRDFAGKRAAAVAGAITADGHAVPLAGARLSVHGARVNRTETTDREGRYRIADLPSGVPLLVTADMSGFLPATKEITLTENGGALDFALSLANVKESVVVTDGFLSVRSDAPEKSQVVTAEQLRELPSNGRRLMQFALLDPHVRQPLGLGTDGNDGNRLSINASSYRHTAYMLDGTVNYDWIYANGPQQTVSVGAVEQFKILSGQYAAEFGTSTAGVLTAITRSGGDAHHGEAIAFVRPSGIQAQAPLASAILPHIPNERTQWGASAGGPLERNRTFYFLNYEGAHQERGAFIQSPKPAFFTGELNEQYALAKLDQRWNDRQWLSWRANGYRFNGNNLNDRVSGFNQPSFGRETRTQSWGSQATLHTVSGALFNELRLSFVSYFPDSAFPLVPSVGISRPSYSTEGFSTNNWVHARTYNAGDVVATRRGIYELKAGFDYVRQLVKDYSFTPFGSYTFAAGPPVANEQPLRYSQTFGAADFRYGQSVWSAFAQDDVHLSSRLTLNLGVRYESQSITKDRNNLAPRLGLAWDAAGNGKTIVRAGAGMFYDQFYLYIYRRFFSLSPFAPTATYTLPFGDPAFPVFPNSLAAAPATGGPARRDLYLPADKLLNPYSLQYSLGVERQLGAGFVLVVDALHSHVLRQMRVNDINHPAPFLRTAPGQARTAAQADATRPYTTFQGVPARLIAVVENSSSSIYDALSFSLSRRFGKRYMLDLHYAISSSATYSMFYADANSGIPNEWDNWGSAERAPSDFYQRRRFVGNGIARLPFGFQLALAGVIGSGLPVNPLTGTDNNGDTYSSDRPIGFGRNSFRTPMQAQLDGAVSRRFRLSDRIGSDVRLELYNVFNRNNYIAVNNVYGEGSAPRATFRQPIAGVTSTDPSRQIQLALKFFF